MEACDEIGWAGVLITRAEYMWNLVFFGAREDSGLCQIPCGKMESAVREVQGKSLHDLAEYRRPVSSPLHNQVMLHKSIQTAQPPRELPGNPSYSMNLGTVFLVLST
jgi:hypothetical protein